MAKAKTKEKEKEKEEQLHVETVSWGDMTWVNIEPPTER